MPPAVPHASETACSPAHAEQMVSKWCPDNVVTPDNSGSQVHIGKARAPCYSADWLATDYLPYTEMYLAALRASETACSLACKYLHGVSLVTELSEGMPVSPADLQASYTQACCLTACC